MGAEKIIADEKFKEYIVSMVFLCKVAKGDPSIVESSEHMLESLKKSILRWPDTWNLHKKGRGAEMFAEAEKNIGAIAHDSTAKIKLDKLDKFIEDEKPASFEAQYTDGNCMWSLMRQARNLRPAYEFVVAIEMASKGWLEKHKATILRLKGELHEAFQMLAKSQRAQFWFGMHKIFSEVRECEEIDPEGALMAKPLLQSMCSLKESGLLAISTKEAAEDFETRAERNQKLYDAVVAFSKVQPRTTKSTSEFLNVLVEQYEAHEGDDENEVDCMDCDPQNTLLLILQPLFKKIVDQMDEHVSKHYGKIIAKVFAPIEETGEEAETKRAGIRFLQSLSGRFCNVSHFLAKPVPDQMGKSTLSLTFLADCCSPGRLRRSLAADVRISDVIECCA